MKRLSIAVTLGFLAASSFAAAGGLPSGRYQGVVQTIGLEADGCRYTDVRMSFIPVGDRTEVRWEEEGYREDGAGCWLVLDATFIPRGAPDTWDVRFGAQPGYRDFTARRDKDVIIIEGSVDTDRLSIRWTRTDSGLDYRRERSGAAGTTFQTTGTLYGSPGAGGV